MIHQASIVIIALFAYSASALAFHSSPVATTGANVYQSLSIPKPTPAPIHGGLRRRENAQKTLLAGPDATCGYFGGNSGTFCFPHLTTRTEYQLYIAFANSY